MDRENYAFQYQKLLEKQADFLLDDGTWWKETNNCVEFYDHTETNSTSTMKPLPFLDIKRRNQQYTKSLEQMFTKKKT